MVKNWWRANVGLLVLFTAMSCGRYKPPQSARPDRVYSTAAQQRAAAVKIISTCPDKRQWVGSGTAIARQVIATAKHVVQCGVHDPIKITVHPANGVPFFAFIRARGVGSADTALLYVPDGELDHVYFERAAPPAPDKTVCMVTAYPAPGRQCGTHQGQFGSERGRHWVGFGVIQGNSGSGVYDAFGRFIGVTTHGAGGVNFAGWSPYMVFDIRF